MKSSTKLSIVFVLSVSLLFSCSLLLWNAKADASLQKVSLGNDLIRIQTGQAIPVVDIQLLENTDYCFVECYAILKIHPYQDIVLPSKSNSEFDWKFEKEKPWMDGLVSHHFEILETSEYKVEVPEYWKQMVNTTCSNEDNTTTYQCETEQTVQTGSHEETVTSSEYKPFAFWGETLKANQDYVIKLTGKLPAKLGPNNIDWIPTIKGIELNNWQWWLSDEPYKISINVTENAKQGNQTDWQIELNLNSTNMGAHFNWSNNGADLRFTNSSNDTILDHRILIWNATNHSATILVKFDKLVNNSVNFFELYYGNTSLPDASTIAAYTLYENFSTASLNTSMWSATYDTMYKVPNVCTLNTTAGAFEYYEDAGASYCKLKTVTTSLPLGLKVTFTINVISGGNDHGMSGYWNYSSTLTTWSPNSSPVVQMQFGYWDGYATTVGDVIGLLNFIFLSNLSGYTNMSITGAGNGSDTHIRTGNSGLFFQLQAGGDPGSYERVQVDNIEVVRWDNNNPTYVLGAEESQDSIPPTITIYSPQNTTYNTSSVDLNWSANEILNWAGYSLNDGTNNTNIFYENPIHLGSIVPNNYYQPVSIFVSDGVAYVTDFITDSLFTFNVSDPFNPVELDSITGVGSPNYLDGANGVYVLDDVAFVASRVDKALSTFNISNPSNIVHLGNITSQDAFTAIYVSEDVAYLTSGEFPLISNAITNYNISNSSNITKLGNITGSGPSSSIYVSNGIAYVTSEMNNSLTAYNVSNPSNIVKLGNISGAGSPNYLGQAKSVFINGNLAYVVSFSDDALTVFNVSNASNIIHVGNISGAGNPNYLNGAHSVFVSGDAAYVVSEHDDALSVFRISDSSNITHVSSITGFGSPNYIGFPYSIFVSDDVAYVVSDYDNALSTFDISKKPVNATIIFPEGPNKITIWANDTTGNMNSTTVYFTIDATRSITFNVTSGETGENLNNVTISCNYSSFNQSSDTSNPYGPYEFPTGTWSCTFTELSTPYYNKTVIFSSNNDTVIDIVMSQRYHLTIQEHNWLEDIYNCLINKDCDVYDLWNQTHEYASNIWDQFKQTDESVVVSEQTTSSVVNDTSNLTVEYSINVPEKENYQFLPIRIFYWFMDENNDTCYNQAKEGNSAEAPFCNPLVAQTMGEVNTQINFTVDLRPDLPVGNYTIVRRIDIDPDQVWINYGHEAIGRLEVTKSNEGPIIKLVVNNNSPKHGEKEPAVQATTEVQQQIATDKTTGMITVNQIDSISYVAVIVSVITLMLVGLMFKNSRKQKTPWDS